MSPSREDASLIIQLAQLAAMMEVGAGSGLIWQPDFDPKKYPPGTDEHNDVLNLMRWMETIGTLYRNSLLDEDLLFDWLAITVVWDKVKPMALSMREHSSPAMWENFEHMAEKQRRWKPTRA